MRRRAASVLLPAMITNGFAGTVALCLRPLRSVSDTRNHQFESAGSQFPFGTEQSKGDRLTVGCLASWLADCLPDCLDGHCRFAYVKGSLAVCPNPGEHLLTLLLVLARLLVRPPSVSLIALSDGIDFESGRRRRPSGLSSHSLSGTRLIDPREGSCSSFCIQRRRFGRFLARKGSRLISMLLALQFGL